MTVIPDYEVKTMKTIRTALLLSFTLLFLILGVWSPAHADFKKTKIAVLDFQMQGDQSASSKDMGKIVAE
jgi:hypothetical protein